MLGKLGELKTNSVALHGGKNPASYERLETDGSKEVFAFKREKAGEVIYYVANFSEEKTSITLPMNGVFTEHMTGKLIEIAGKELELKAWEYLILKP